MEKTIIIKTEAQAKNCIRQASEVLLTVIGCESPIKFSKKQAREVAKKTDWGNSVWYYDKTADQIYN